MGQIFRVLKSELPDCFVSPNLFVAFDGCFWGSEINLSVQWMFFVDQGLDKDGTAAIVIGRRVELQRVGVLQELNQSLCKDNQPCINLLLIIDAARTIHRWTVHHLTQFNVSLDELFN